ncbi:MAG: hypothetical protein EPO02_13030 [Nitrospirae bacterium]|nr:MAG: hypothetical protein EPO02_13030 [Nitrospirota bacterium]
MASFPALRSGQVTMTPLTRSAEFVAAVYRFRNGSEQRCLERGERARFVLSHSNLTGYDVATLRDFWRSTKAAFDATWDVTIDAVTYSNCAFESDEFIATETKAERYSVSLKVMQVP